MKETRILMGMPITVEIADAWAGPADIDAAFDYLRYVDETFSTYKDNSEISRINRGELTLAEACEDMRVIFDLAEQTRRETDGYFDIRHNGICDPSGVVKGWAIDGAAGLLRGRGFRNYYVEAGGDAQLCGRNGAGGPWRVGIRSPFDLNEIVKVLAASDCGVATSGTYIRGQHIYNPHAGGQTITDILSLTVVGPNITDADRFATAAFAMGAAGIVFIESLAGYEGYMINQDRQAVLTSGFGRYLSSS